MTHQTGDFRMTAKRIVVLAGDYVEDYEIMVPFQALQMLGHTVHAICPGKIAGEQVRHGGARLRRRPDLQRKPGPLHLNASLPTASPSKYDALLIPGGRAPEYLRLNPDVLNWVRHFMANKPVAAVCHGVQPLTAAGYWPDAGSPPTPPALRK